MLYGADIPQKLFFIIWSSWNLGSNSILLQPVYGRCLFNFVWDCDMYKTIKMTWLMHCCCFLINIKQAVSSFRFCMNIVMPNTSMLLYHFEFDHWIWILFSNSLWWIGLLVLFPLAFVCVRASDRQIMSSSLHSYYISKLEVSWKMRQDLELGHGTCHSILHVRDEQKVRYSWTGKVFVDAFSQGAFERSF